MGHTGGVEEAEVRFAAGAPVSWQVFMRGGEVVDVWAHAYSTEGEHYVFEVLTDTRGALPDSALVTARTPSNPERLALAVARFPVAAVRDIGSAGV